MGHRRWIFVAMAGVFACATPAFAQANRSLEKCQKEISNRLGKYVAAKEKVLGNCLAKVARELIKSNDPIADAARACGAQLRKLASASKPDKTLREKTRAKILKRCDPGSNPKIDHTAAQVLDLVPPMVPQGIEAKNLDTWCSYFDFDPNSVPAYADGSLDSIDEWLDCAFAVADCNADSAVVTQVPRAVEWLVAIEPEIVALGDRYTDAVTALDEIQDAIDILGNGSPTINCGPGVDSCGDAIANGTDQCDGADLDGATCATLGFKGGTLACDAACYYDFSGCIPGAFPATGQTVSYLAGDDGDLELGAAFNLTNNGDGTISDTNSGLMWEVKDNAGGLHDRDGQYTWTNSFDVFLDQMNATCDGDESTPCTADADCTGIGNELCGHAGYRDWRMPNRTELQTIVNLGASTPAVPSEFDDSCSGSCDVTSCSCTRSTAVAKYWSSSTYVAGDTQAWYVDFGEGDTNFDGKFTTQFVRAVRAGGF